MASAIDAYLEQILRATYGRDVRDAIYHGIATCYADTTTGVNRAQEVANNAATYLASAEAAANQAKNTADNASTLLSNRIDSFDTQVTQKIAGYDASISTKISAIDTKIGTIDSQISAASTAIRNANSAADSINNLTVTYTNVGPDEQGSVTKTKVNDYYVFNFALRQGAKGDSMVIKGKAYNTLEALKAAITNPSIGDMYNVGSAPSYTIYRWTGDTSVGSDGWESQGQFGSTIASVSSNEIDGLWGGGSAASDTEYLDNNGLGYLIGKITTSLGNKVNTESNKRLMTDDEATKLAGIASGAQVNVQADWNQASSTAADFIKNKPTIPSGVVVDSSWVTNSTNPVQSKVIKASIDALDAKHISITNSSILTFAPTWSASTDTNFGYYADLSKSNSSAGSTAAAVLDNISADHYVDVVFSSTDVVSGNYSPICESRTGAVRIWSNVNTASSITLLTISAWR